MKPMAREEIAITGLSARFAQADDLAEFKEKLYAGFDFVTADDSRWPRGYMGLPERSGIIRDLSLFDANFFGVHPRQAHMMDPQMRLLIETTYEAMIDAGYDPETLRGRKIGVFVACGKADSDEAFSLDLNKVDGFSLLGSSEAMMSNRLSYNFDFLGPSFTIDAACSSTITALSQAVLAMRCGECESAIVAASMINLRPTMALGFMRMGMLSPDGKCKVFDSRCDGFVRSETVGALFLQRVSEARRIYARVVDVKATADGYKIQGITYPSRKAQEELLRSIYSEAQVDPSEVEYIEAHGTGTKAGDAVEMEAISKIFCQRERQCPLKVGAVKSNAGHGEVASGISSIAKVILAMETGTIAPNLHFEEPNPNIPSLHDGSVEIVAKPTPYNGGIVGLNSFGFGGASAHVILNPSSGPHVDGTSRESPELPRLVLVSGRSADSLAKTLDRMDAEGPYPDSAYALLNHVGQRSVKQFPYRGFALVPLDDSARETVKAVEQSPSEKRPVWFVFSGMGCQWKAMARQMMQFDAFARSMRKCSEFVEQFGIDLIKVTTSDSVDTSTASTLASVAALQVALVDMLRAIGVHPDGIVGHSVGETACAYADGCFTAEQTVLSAYWRGRSVELGSLPKGAMAAVGLTWEEATKRCRDGVVPACHNAEDSVTLSGPADAVAELVEELKGEGVFARQVDSMNAAFHSKYMKSIGPALREALLKIIPQPIRRSERWVSSSVPTSRWKEPAAQLCSAEYYVNNLVSPVLFSEALQQVPKNAILVEIAPHCLLQSILKRAVGTGATCLGLMKRGADNPTYFLTSLGKLHTLGVQMDLSSLYPPVPFPVPRGTPSVGHLVSWDHSQRWTVAKWNDFAGLGHSAEEVVTVDLEANEEDAYLAGHYLGGRVIFPVAGYMMMAWKYLAKRYGKPLDQLPVIFEDVAFHRATILPKKGPVRFLVHVMRASGEFEVSEAGAVAASGRIRIAEEGENVLDKDPPGPPSESSVNWLEAEDFYEELRRRGFEYQGGFRSIFKIDFQSSFGTIKWDDNWVTFIDNMLQFCILPSPRQTFMLPVRIRTCRIDPAIHARVARDSGDAGVPMERDSFLNTWRSGGIAIHGLKTSVAQQRVPQQTPCLDEYKFAPYIDDECAENEREVQVQEYIDVCSCVANRILATNGQNGSKIYEYTNGSEKYPQEVLSDYLEHPAENHVILKVLTDVEKGMKSHASNLSSALLLAVATHQSDLDKDLVNTALFTEDPVRHLLDVAVENTSCRRMCILELAPDARDLILAPFVLPLLPLSNILLKTEYTVAHPYPAKLAAEKVPEGVKIIAWDQTSPSENSLPIADVIVVRDAPAESDRLETLAGIMSAQCNEDGFVFIHYRIALTPAEKFLSTVGGVPLSHHQNETIEAAFAAFGFSLVGRKSNRWSTILLLRKVNAVFPADRQEVIRVQNSKFDWVDTLKTNVLNSESKPACKKIWLFADDQCISGIVGLANCLQVERGKNRIRCVFDVSKEPSRISANFTLESEEFKRILERDLVMNIYRDGQWGSYRHLTIQTDGATKTMTEYAFLNVKTRGDLSSLQWYESALRYEPPPSAMRKVLCHVYFASLNFRDVMLATGKLPSDALPDDMASRECVIGLEFSGRDPQGRRVMGLVPSEAVATTVAVAPDFLWEIPDSWSLEEASTVPVAYCTAYYALLLRGNMRPGESLLVHSGSGGVGQAAISIALSMGCTVFATVGSNEKREFLKRRFPQLEDRNIASSRDLSFEEQILRETKGKGVDLVLNSLSEEKLQASVRCLARHGRFLEIGKFDLAQNSPLGMAIFLKGASFCGVLLDLLHEDGPNVAEDKRRLRDLFEEGIASGAVKPLNVTCFKRDQAQEAFRFMASGKHIGKVVLEIRPEESDNKRALGSSLIVEAVKRTYFYAHKSYVLIGGLGGFALELADWMVGRGCRKLLLSSRSGVRTGYQKFSIHRWQQTGAEVHVSTADASTEQGARQIIDEALAMGPVGGIFNLAMVLRDALLENQTADTFEAACRIKVAGTVNLDELSRNMCPQLDHFVAFSSLVAGRGSVGQINYGYANSVMERICERRVRDGLPGLAIQWGPIGDVGVLSRTYDTNYTLSGCACQRIESCLSVLDQFLSQDRAVVSSFVKKETSLNADETKTKTRRDLVDTIANIFGVKDSSSLDPNASFGDLGMDSLIGVEVQQTLERDYDVNMSMTELRKLTMNRVRNIELIGADKFLPLNNGAGSQRREDSTAGHRGELLKIEDMLVPAQALVEMNGLDGATPVFMVHPIHGQVNALMELAGHLNIRMVGVQRTAEIPVRSIKEMASIYIKKLAQVQPKGPYHLAGYSFGATVAFEMAVQLQSSGACVDSLTLLDGSPSYVGALWSEYKSRFGSEGDAESFLFCSFLAQYTDINTLEVQRQLKQCPNLDAKKEASTDILIRAIPDCRLRRQDVVTAVQVFHDLFIVGSKYRPHMKFQGNVMLVKASMTKTVARQLPPDYHLSEFVQGNVEMVTVDGSHEGFITGEGARQCAGIIARQVLR